MKFQLSILATRRVRARAAIGALAVAVLVGSCGIAAAAITVPASWQGVWETTRVQVDCVSHQVLGTTVHQDTLCAGRGFPLPAGFLCSGTMTDTDLNATCTETMEVLPGCSLTVTDVTTFTRTGGSATGTQTLNFVYTGSCPVGNSCQMYNWTATQLALDPGCTQVPIEPTTWGTVKESYR